MTYDADAIPEGAVYIPEDVDPDWSPPGYEPGPDDPGPVTTVHCPVGET